MNKFGHKTSMRFNLLDVLFQFACLAIGTVVGLSLS